jgi:hypothetical protein
MLQLCGTAGGCCRDVRAGELQEWNKKAKAKRKQGTSRAYGTIQACFEVCALTIRLPAS